MKHYIEPKIRIMEIESSAPISMSLSGTTEGTDSKGDFQSVVWNSEIEL